MNKYISPHIPIDVPLTDSPIPIEDREGNPRKDKNGNIEYCSTDRCSLAEIISRTIALGIPESEYKNVLLYAAPPYHRASDWDLFCVYNKPKTEEQIALEKTEQENLEKEKQSLKAERKKIREAKKAEKEAVLASLTPKQKKALGIKDTLTPGYAGGDEIGGSDF